jgi:hypothetical protein
MDTRGPGATSAMAVQPMCGREDRSTSSSAVAMDSRGIR